MIRVNVRGIVKSTLVEKTAKRKKKKLRENPLLLHLICSGDCREKKKKKAILAPAG